MKRLDGGSVAALPPISDDDGGGDDGGDDDDEGDEGCVPPSVANAGVEITVPPRKAAIANTATCRLKARYFPIFVLSQRRSGSDF